jgi:UDP-glucose 4-epimerase
VTGAAGPVVVTGTAGLVGAAALQRLRGQGIDVVDVRRVGPPADPSSLVLDLATESLSDALVAIAPSVIVHCAAAVPTNPAYPDDDDSASRTRAIDRNVRDAAEASGARVVYFSSCGLYDPHDPAVKTEESTVDARTPYFQAKVAGEELLGALPDTAVLRLSGPIGPAMRANLVLPRFVALALQGQELTLWGSGGREQDYVAVDDVADLVARAVHQPVGGTFNVASGGPVTMRRLADTVVEVVGAGRVTLVDQADPMERDTARYSVARSREAFGWAPQTDLSAMIRQVASALTIPKAAR